MQIDGPKQKKGETKKPYFNVINKEHSQTQFGKTKKKNLIQFVGDIVPNITM